MVCKTHWRLQPLSVIPELNTKSRQDVLNSVEQLQMWTGDNTCLNGLSTQELIELQAKLETEI
jgi:hypothetical protein